MNFKNCKYNHLELAKKFDELADKFEELGLDRQVDMHEFCVSSRTLCGSPACHGGWGLVALDKNNLFGWKKFYKENLYNTGASLISEFLGFRWKEDLLLWALNNPKYWGSDAGDAMFCDGEAFGWDSDEGTLGQIVEWYRGVASRLRAIVE